MDNSKLLLILSITCLCCAINVTRTKDGRSQFLGNGTNDSLDQDSSAGLTIIRDREYDLDQPDVDKESLLEHILEAQFVETPAGESRPVGLKSGDKDEVKAENLDHHQYKKKSLKPLTKEKRNFNVGSQDNLWPDGLVPYLIAHKRSATKSLINSAIEEFNKHTCVKFVPRTTEMDYVVFEDGNGCGSWIGVIGGKQTITLHDPGCIDIETVLHEMCHALGQLHEQSRSDRYPYLRTNWQNIPVDYGYNFDRRITQNGIPYDQHSVLQYSLFSFSTNSHKKSMYLTDSRLDFLTEQTRNLTFYDKQDISAAYQCTRACVDPPVCQNGGYLNYLCLCVCPNGLKGDTCIEIDGNCGEIMNLTIGELYTIKSSNYPSSYNLNDKCVWLLKAPEGAKIKATVTDMDIAYNHELTRCYHWLEVQYNLIGQPGILKCGELQGGQTLEYETSNNEDYNHMMFKFDSQFVSDKSPTRGFFMTVQAFYSGCHINPCKSGGTCIEGPGDGTFICLCFPGYSGETCSKVKASATLECNFEIDLEGNCFLDSDLTADLEWSMLSIFFLGSRSIKPNSGYVMAGLYIYKLTYYGDVARLITNLEFEATPRCLQLQYQITSFALDQYFYLDISYTGTGVTRTSLFNQKSDTGNKWKDLSIDIPSVESLQIIIEGSVGDREVVIDNLVLSPGPCSGPCVTSRPCMNGGSCVPVGSDSFTCECLAGYSGNDCSVTGPLTSYSCTFEEGSDCFLSQSKKDNWNWLVTSRETPSKSTGPSFAVEGVYFSYLETTSTSEGQTAVYESNIDFIATDRCLLFYYHMFGLAVSSLEVQTEGTSSAKTVSWMKSYSQGNRWHKTGVDIPSVEGLKLYIEATSGGHFTGDIAIDNVVLRPGLCLCDSSPCMFGGTCTQVNATNYECRCPAGFSGEHCDVIDLATLICSFENTFCSFLEQESEVDSTDWMLNQGSTPSSDTGPTMAAAGTYYLYLESNDQRGAKARLNSLYLSEAEHCLKFSYNMFGTNMGTLNVIVDNEEGEVITWSKTGDQGEMWHQVEIDLNITSISRVILEGIIGDGDKSDIAIDFVSISPMTCENTTSLCSSNPCLNGGVCNETAMSFYCTCTSNYTGSTCQLEVIDGEWGTWIDGACSVTCGSGQLVRTRSCDKPKPTNGGADCDGVSSEVIPCSRSACPPINGNWGEWSGFTSCSASCGGGTQSRIRSCNNPAPSYGGIFCAGLSTESKICNTEKCPADEIFSCTFESSDSTCFLVDEKDPSKDNFDWTTHSGRTKIKNTGPSFAASGSFYKYIQTNRPRKKGQKARLVNAISLKDLSRCLTFSYNMNGRQIGSLNVLSVDSAGRETVVWSKSGNQGNVWKQVKVNVNTAPNLQMAIEGIVGGVKGNIAVDNILLEPEACPPCDTEPCQNGATCSVSGDTYVCRCLPGYGGSECQYIDAVQSCSFEKREKSCFLVQDELNDDFDWSRRGADNNLQATPSKDTGPQGANDGKTFYYIEATKQQIGSKARLLSNLQFSDKKRCLTFSFHMYGDHIGTFKVLSKDNSNTETELWSLTGNQGNQWLDQMVSVHTLPDSVIILEATVGGDKGDISIDNLNLLTTDCSICGPVNPCRNNGRCSISGDTYSCTCSVGFAGAQCQYINAVRTCNFEKFDPTCFLTDDDNDNFDWSMRKSATTTKKTGPPSARSGTRYAYIESSRKSGGSKARLISNVQFSDSTRCLSFWYHMFGVNIGKLRVLSLTSVGVETELWSAMGDKGNNWLAQSITVSTLPESKIVIEASVGGPKGDIAIDQVSLSTRPCG